MITATSYSMKEVPTTLFKLKKLLIRANLLKETFANIQNSAKLKMKSEIMDEIVRRLGAQIQTVLPQFNTSSKSGFKFHDDAVKEYFYEKFPEIFDEHKNNIFLSF